LLSDQPAAGYPFFKQPSAKMKLSNSTLPPFPLLTATIIIPITKNNQELKAIFMAGYTCYTFENTGLKYSLQFEIARIKKVRNNSLLLRSIKEWRS
jgi:hypothetical protein